MQRIAIVTGCAGFLASTFVEQLLNRGWFVYGIDKITKVSNTNRLKYLQKVFPNSYKVVKEDICEVTWLPDADVLFNFAAESDVDNSNKSSKEFFKSNVSGVANLLEVLNNQINIKNSKTMFFQISTDEVYGDLISNSANEDSKLNPSNPYAASKAAADMLIMAWNRTHEQPFTIVRPSNNYGPHQYPEKLIPLAVKNLNRGLPINLHNKGTPIRVWTHVYDTVDAILTIYHAAEFNCIYNISSEFSQTNLATVEKILSAYGVEQSKYSYYVNMQHNRPGQDVRYSITCEPLKRLGWKPKKQFDDSINLLVQEYRKEFRW